MLSHNREPHRLALPAHIEPERSAREELLGDAELEDSLRRRLEQIEHAEQTIREAQQSRALVIHSTRVLHEALQVLAELSGASLDIVAIISEAPSRDNGNG